MDQPPALAAPAPTGEVAAYVLDLDVFGVSDHSNHAIIYRQVNPGLGLTLGRIVDENVDWTLAVGTYLDSYDVHARYAMIGPRFVLGERMGWHIDLVAEVGYLYGSHKNGGTMIPVVQVGYDRVNLCVTGSRGADTRTYNPAHNPNFASTSAIALFAELEVLRF
jgi:hypothetical protein